MKTTQQLGSGPIGRLLIQLSLPATTGMIVMALYNLVDTIFVGRGVGSLAIGGLTIVMPIQMLIFASTQTLGMGGSSLISRKLGAKEYEGANLGFGNLITLTLLLSGVVLITGYGFTESILFLFGARGRLSEPATTYFTVILLGTPFLCYSMVFNSILRAEGNARTAMIAMVMAAVINMILDGIFIFYFHWGIKGAAWASVIAQFATFIYTAAHFLRGNSSLTFHSGALVLNRPIVKEIFAIGVSSLGRHGAGSLLAAILNHSLFTYGGALAVAAYGIINRILRVVFMPMMGLIQGFLPICGYNYGARQWQRVWNVFSLASRWITALALFNFTVLLIFTPAIFSVFTHDQNLIALGVRALRFIILLTPIVGFQMVSASYFQAVGKALPSFILALSRQLLLLLPLLLILPRFWGLDGIWYAFPLSDMLSVIITLIMILPELKKLKQKWLLQ